MGLPIREFSLPARLKIFIDEYLNRNRASINLNAFTMRVARKQSQRIGGRSLFGWENCYAFIYTKAYFLPLILMQ